MQTLHSIDGLRAAISSWRQAGERVALVPTMGNLHAGHLDLVRRARELASRVVVSVFVNPTQFGQGEDFDRYPRTLEQDSERLRSAHADLLFAPSVNDMYPRGYGAPLSRVCVPELSAVLEGEFRPGHFDGVATVVTILLNLVQPDVAVFGEKDYQQLLVIRRMVEDLHQPVAIVGHPTLREPDGLALSSRNQYLSPEERRTAPALHRALTAVAERIRAGARDFDALCVEATRLLEKQGFRPQYLSVRAPDLSEAQAGDREWVILVAAYLGRTRLIDNIKISI